MIEKPGKLVFDIGANVGDLTAHFLEMGTEKVIAVEPTTGCVQHLQHRFADDPRVTVLNKAVSSTAGTAMLYHCDRASGLNTLNPIFWNTGRHAGNTWSTSEPCALLTLTNMAYQLGQPDYVKIDVEGHELAVLEGLIFAVPLVSFECHIEHKDELLKCLDRLAVLRFTSFCYHEHEVKFPIEEPWMRLDEIKSAVEAEQNPLWWGNIFAQP